MDMTQQRRAGKGGEIGANGEWYEGGRFIATQEHTVKQAPRHVEWTPADEARRAADTARIRRIAEWLEWRRVAVADIVARLTANPGDVDDATWTRRVEDYAAGFLPGLGRQLDVGGSLSRKQAECVAKNLIGRRTKRNAGEWDALVDVLTEQFPE